MKNADQSRSGRLRRNHECPIPQPVLIVIALFAAAYNTPAADTPSAASAPGASAVDTEVGEVRAMRASSASILGFAAPGGDVVGCSVPVPGTAQC
jgi:hypothetical protein